MNIPAAIRIDGIDYRVEHSDAPVLVDRQECLGSIDYITTTIKLSNEQSEQAKQQTLLHEVFHGLMRCKGLQVEDEELLVDMLSRGMYQVLEDNPELFYGEAD